MSTEGLMEPVPGVEPTKGGLYLWRYVPNVGAAVLFLILFMGSFLYISWKIWRTRALFCLVFAVGCFSQFIFGSCKLAAFFCLTLHAVEMVGYGVRAGAHNNTGKLMSFVVQNFFLLVAPVLFAASIYMILGRIITSVRGDKYSAVKPSKITLTFVGGDVLSFLVQGGGAGLSVVQKPGLAQWAERIVVIGLLIQIIMFALFCLLAVVFHRRMRRAPTAQSYAAKFSWEACLYMLYAVSVLIMARSIFRVVEYCQGQTGYALSHEWTLYVFDSVPMFAVTVIFGWRFPGNVNDKYLGQPECLDMGH